MIDMNKDKLTFSEWWEEYGELVASMCNGNIQQFASEVWKSAQEKKEGIISESCNGIKELIEED